jgi:coenzyme F420-0:L-glutamate ligase/coenzyme F420-1:gamma-L-glutamate ligase
LTQRSRNRLTTLIPVRLPTVEVGEPLDGVILRSLKKRRIKLSQGDIVAIASKVVSTCENRLQDLNEVRVKGHAKRLSRKWTIDQEVASIVLEEADQILGGVKGFLLTIKNGILTANAGIDLKNCPPGFAILWPKNADESAKLLRKSLEREYHARLGVVVVDSRVTPLRLGTVGLAIGSAGFHPVRDNRGTPDIYGRKVKVTQTNIADDIASAAHMIMGEANERIGAVVVRGAPVSSGKVEGSRRTRLSVSRCLITSRIKNINTYRLG